MNEIADVKNPFTYFKGHYYEVMEKFLFAEESSETYLNEGYQLGRQAMREELGILSVTAIHHDCLIDILEKITTNDHLVLADKASLFLEEVLASFQMIATGFRPAIQLLNQRSVEFALRIRALNASLHEKDALLKEVYHRVKNNLQVVSSLLSLQINTTTDVNARKVLTENASRIKAMSLIHEMLYQTENLAQIEMQKYISMLVTYLTKIYEIRPNCIKFILDIAELSFNMDMAIPCGLIINELVSNAIKYAFPNNETGKVNIILKEENQQNILIVHDNGIATQDHNFQDKKTLGMKLIHSLTKQLSGKINFDMREGFLVTIYFPKNIS